MRDCLLPLALLPLLIIASPVCATTVVLKSSGPSARNFPPGMRLPVKARIKLCERDVLTLLDRHGTMVKEGMATFRVDETIVRDRSMVEAIRKASARGVQSSGLSGGRSSLMECQGSVIS